MAASRPPLGLWLFVHPGNNEVSVLKAFETSYDGSVTGTSGSSPANEALAVAGLNFLAEQVQRRKVKDALMLANQRGAVSTRRTRSAAGATRPARAVRSLLLGGQGLVGHGGVERGGQRLTLVVVPVAVVVLVTVVVMPVPHACLLSRAPRVRERATRRFDAERERRTAGA